ncbi:MAG TPA: hypothetical protein VM367_04520 [Pseudonocardia sp.]|nr:hypothetical protein [Pseudonocardia sp.]
MKDLRPPAVAGVAGGVGTTTVAVALRGRDAGRAVADADVVVCRASGDSLRRVARLADALPATGPRPVLAVTGATRGPVAARLGLLERRFARIVVLPDVPRWRELADPLAEVSALLGRPTDRLPRPARAYVEALRELATAVADGGRLQVAPSAPAPVTAAAPAAPEPAATGERPARGDRPAPRRLWSGLRPVERPAIVRASNDGPDDLAVEEGVLPPVRPLRAVATGG